MSRNRERPATENYTDLYCRTSTSAAYEQDARASEVPYTTRSCGVPSTYHTRRGAGTFTFTTLSESRLFCIYKCEQCGSVNLQYLPLRLSQTGASESSALTGAKTFHSMIIRSLIGNRISKEVFEAASFYSRCLKCGKRPGWACGQRKIGPADVAGALSLLIAVSLLTKFLYDRAVLSALTGIIPLIAMALVIPVWFLFRMRSKSVKLPETDSPVLFGRSVKELRGQMAQRSDFAGVDTDGLEGRYAGNVITKRGLSGLVMDRNRPV